VRQRRGGFGFGEFEFVPLRAVGRVDLPKPAAPREALRAGRILDNSVEREVLADHDVPHGGSAYLGVVLPPG
jgi:hypothetical protein